MAYQVVGLRDTLSAALETSSLSPMGVTTRLRDDKSSTTTVLDQCQRCSTKQQTTSFVIGNHLTQERANQVLHIQSTPVDTCSHKAKEYYNNVQASPSDDYSKPLITLSAMGFIYSTYLENFSPEHPIATP